MIQRKGDGKGEIKVVQEGEERENDGESREERENKVCKKMKI